MPNVGINKNIFLKDQNIFVQKLLGQFSEEELAAEKKRILHCLWLAGEPRSLPSLERKIRSRTHA